MTELNLYDPQIYGRELGRISPEGNRYGQIRMVRDIYHYHFWDGEEWTKVPEAIDQADSYSLLPTSGQSHGDVWRVRRYDDKRSKYLWQYWFWNSGNSSWKVIRWLWDLEKTSDLPDPGHFVGEGHRILESDILAKWTGYEWVRAVSHSGLEDNEPDRHVPETFADDYAAQVTDTHGRISTVNSALIKHGEDNVKAFELVYFDLDEMDEDIGQMEETVQNFSELVTELDESFAELGNVVNAWSDNGYLTLAEANSFGTAKEQLLSESDDVIQWANSLGLSDEADDYQDALDALVAAIAPWINSPPYPKEITSLQRDGMVGAFKAVVEKKTILVKAIDDATINGVFNYFGSRISEAVVEFKNKTHIAVYGSVTGSTGAIWCSGELLITDLVDDVTNVMPVLNYVGGAIIPTHIEPSAEYFIYIANHKSQAAFNVPALPADGDKPATTATDFNGNLFLSQSADVNGLLGASEPGINARLVGKCETDATSYALGGPFFIREINMSMIGRTTDLSDAFSEYSDFQVTFSDKDTLSFSRFDGTKGLCYVAGSLLSLGTGLQLTRSDYRINWMGGDTPLELDETGGQPTTISSNTLYQIYLSADIDDYNFNSINPSTGRPYEEGNINYVWAKDLRKRMFLSTKTNDHRLLDEQYPGYYARHIGQVMTDSAGYFKYSSDISLIRQLTLNPTYLDGMAEAHIVLVDTTSFKVAKNKGTTGIVMVGGYPCLTYEESEASVHVASKEDYVQIYTESNFSSPLSDAEKVKTYTSDTLFLYLANNQTFWGDKAEKLFWCQVAPVKGYLSSSWGGNNARWIATIKTNSIGEFSGDYVIDAIAPIYTRIDDSTVSRSSTWSSEKIALQVAIAAQGSSGIPIRLEYYNTTSASLLPTQGTALELKFRDESTYTVAAGGISVSFSGQPSGTLRYLYINNSGTVYFSASQWDYAAANVRYLGNDILVGLVGFTGTGSVSGDWNVVSAMNHQKRTYYVYDPSQTGAGNPIYTTVQKNFNGIILDSGMYATAQAEGTVNYHGYWVCSGYHENGNPYYVTAALDLVHPVTTASASTGGYMPSAYSSYSMSSSSSVTIPSSPSTLTYHSSWAPTISVTGTISGPCCYCAWASASLTKTSSSAKLTITIE